MNQIARVEPSETNAIEILRNTFYVGAKVESVRLVLDYCRAQGLDPMLRPVHIVPVYNKAVNGMVDTVMPGIGLYRILAQRTNQYAGKTEPEFGPDVTQTLGGVEVPYPQWGKITVFRNVNGEARSFSATERWLENYATAKRDNDAPNAMWKKRAYGQLAKCAEAQALRMAFPEQAGGYTAEEMEGKGDYIDVQPEHLAPATPTYDAASKRTNTLLGQIRAARTDAELSDLLAKDTVANWIGQMQSERPELALEIDRVVTLRTQALVSDVPEEVSE